MRGELRKYRYPFVLALIAIAVLAIGLALKPAPKPAARKRPGELAATRAELESLQRLVRRNSLRNFGSQFTSVAERAADYLLPVANSSDTGIPLAQSALLLPKSEDELPRAISVGGSDGQAHSVSPGAWVPGLPFVIGNAPLNITPAPVGDIPARGDWVVAVSAAQNGNSAFRPGVFNGATEANCGFVGEKLVTTVPLSGDMGGAAVFDLDVRLIGIVVSCDEGMAIIAVGEIQRANRAASTERLLALYGMAVSGDINAWKQIDPRATGVVVSEVWDRWPADAAGVNAGDFITRIDGQAVASEQQAESLLAGAGAHVLEVRQRKRPKRVFLQAVSAQQPSLRGASMEESAPGVGIVDVTPRSSAARAGIRSGDRIVEIDGAAATKSSVEQTITPYQAAKPATVVLQRDSRQLAVVVTP